RTRLTQTRRRNDPLTARPREPTDAPVFTTRHGNLARPVKRRSTVLKPAAKRAAVPWAGFHTLRPTCATILFRDGMNAKQVQMWLGHHSPAFTLATDVHLSPTTSRTRAPADPFRR